MIGLSNSFNYPLHDVNFLCNSSFLVNTNCTLVFGYPIKVSGLSILNLAGHCLRILYNFCRFSSLPLSWWGYGFWNGYPADLKDQGRIS